jgi:hypothetical protein
MLLQEIVLNEMPAATLSGAEDSTLPFESSSTSQGALEPAARPTATHPAGTGQLMA